MQRPTSNEYNPYFQSYINLVPEGDFSDLLDKNTVDALRFFEDIEPEKHNYRYAEGKWTIKDILMHLIDTERVMSYRALVAARGDSNSPLPYMDEDAYAQNVNTFDRDMDSLIDEFAVVRSATGYLFEYLTDEQSQRIGNAHAHPITPRALYYIIIGHVQHHINVIQERYL